MKPSTRTVIVLVSAALALLAAFLFYAFTRPLTAPVGRHAEAEIKPGEAPTEAPVTVPRPAPAPGAPVTTEAKPSAKTAETTPPDMQRQRQQGSRDKRAPKEASSDRLALIDEILHELDVGNAVFNAPRQMEVDEPADIQLVLGIEKTLDEVRNRITARGEKIEARIRVSDRMEARLSGSNFSISALTPEIQAVSRADTTQWRWEVIPRKTGKHVLHLTLDVLLDIDGSVAARNLRTFDQEIEVQVSWSKMAGDFVKANWQWLWAAILVPLSPWIFEKFRRRRRS